MPTDKEVAVGEKADSASETLSLAEEAEAEAAEAEAVAAAARARARAIRLRRQAAEADRIDDPVDDVEIPDVADEAVDDEFDDDEADDDEVGEGAIEPSAEKPARRLRLHRPRWKVVAVSLAILLTCALAAASGYMVWFDQQAGRDAQRQAEFTAAARQGVVTFMSLDFTKAEENVQSILANATGEFKKDFEEAAADFTRVAEESKVVTTAKVNAAAVESMTDDTAVVLVAASSTVTNAAGADQERRSWRLSVSVARDGGQIKVSKVEFVP